MFIIFLFIFLSGCSQKKLTVASLHPGIIQKKFKSIKINEFYNDSINQKNYLKEKIANKVINGKKIFNVKKNYNADVVLKGEVLESSLDYDFYYDQRVDYSRCRYYKYDEKKKKKTCREYRIIRIPCEDRYYRIATKIDLINNSDSTLLFSKIYTNTYNKNICYNHRNSFYPNRFMNRDKQEVNSRLALELSNEILNDISPHYVYFNIPIMTELDEEKINYNENQEKEFETIIELIFKKHIKKAKEKLTKFDVRSVEAVYNLALIYEYENKLLDANKLYNQAYKMTKKTDYLNLINSAILRTKKNLEEKIKAKSLLP